MFLIAPLLTGVGLVTTVASANTIHNHGFYINYTTVTGYFLQDEPTTNPTTFDYTAVDFGLINRTYPSDSNPQMKGKTQWQRFANQVYELNRASGRNVEYKVLFLGRHGQGYHNAAETYYGTPAWDCYWSERDGNGTATWADAHLTAQGIAQAEIAHNFWASEIKNQHIPTPQSYYTSPLYRCLDTARITFSGLNLPALHPFIPEIKELFRETISGHTCDRRSNKTFIHDSFPKYRIEPGFSEQDLLWVALHGETTVDEKIRSKTVLDEVFFTDRSTYISVTSHSGEISALLTVLGHQSFSLNTGAVIPVLVKAVTIPGKAPITATQSYIPLSTCSTVPPLPTIAS